MHLRRVGAVVLTGLLITISPTQAWAQPTLGEPITAAKPVPVPPGAPPGNPAVPGQSGPQVGPNLLVSDPSDLPGLVQSETSLAVFGATIAHGWNDSKAFFQAGVGVSGRGQSVDDWDNFVDGGDLPQIAGLIQKGDPAVTVCGDGTFHYASIAGVTIGANPTALVVNRGDIVNGTIVWQTPVVAESDPIEILDKEYLVCDRNNGNLYMSYTRFFTAFSLGQIEFIRSTDAGQTWGAPVVLQVEETVVNQGSYPAVGPNGEVCVAWQRGWLDGNPVDTIEIRCSTNQGVSFGPRNTVVSFTSNAFTEPIGYNRSRISDFPGIDIDKSSGPSSGTIYVAYHDGDLDLRDVKLVSSTDLGATWSASVTVNDDAGDGSDEFFPWVNLDPDGRVGVLWYSNDGGITDVFIDISDGSGGTDIRVTDVATNWPATSADIQPNFGDYINLASTSNYFHASWADGRNGDPDVFYATIRSSDVLGVETRFSNLPRTGSATVPTATPNAVFEVFGQEEDLGLSPQSLLDNGNITASLLDGTPLTVTAVSAAETATGVTLYFNVDVGPVCAFPNGTIFSASLLDDAGDPLSVSTKFVVCSP